ncbi:single-stranded DNA-binding protein (plasmid) [Escherichia coli]|uniref:DNA-Binding protein G5P n=1 Tax=Erwinia phage PEar6 TaxID=2776820 RepID=A0A7T1TVZ9_9VIRU|nr:ssDNA-binding protein [Erwinia phage PEar6]QHJ82158.1 MAG: hypothetical protein [Inoviridae sp.]QOI67851.1 ssDNA-binding protein pV [Erwinia phage PEar1]QOI67861.1 ssDNA-binding protein pV [Erwinia phage PEar2]QOI67871.1 ssDNA-binding protein pV [Erwinia phage PEar4]HEB5398756.1 DNA-binding protein [Klebsiella pneumoniae]
MLTVEIHESQVSVKERSGVSQKSGKPYTIREQEAYIDLGGVYPALFNFNLEDGQHPYPAGKYRVHPASFKINNFGQVAVGRVLLESVKSA